MRSLIVVFILVLVAATTYRSFGSAETGTGTLTLPPPEPNVNAEVKNFDVEDVEGDRFVLSDKGVYVLTFWSTLNEGSDEAQPDFERLARKYGDDGVSFAAVYVNSAPRDGDAPYAMIQDGTGKLTSWYNVKHVPRLFLIDDGTIDLVQTEYYDGDELEKALEDALAEESGGRE